MLLADTQDLSESNFHRLSSDRRHASDRNTDVGREARRVVENPGGNARDATSYHVDCHEDLWNILPIYEIRLSKRMPDQPKGLDWLTLETKERFEDYYGTLLAA